MTEVEAFELALMAKANAVQTFTVYITFTFAYLAAAYFVGKKLTRFQSLAASGLYMFAAMSAVINHQSDVEFLGIALDHTGSLQPRELFSSSEFWSVYIGILSVIGIIIGLYFMWSVRHPKTE